MSWNAPGESRFGIHSIDHFALEVPSLDKAQHFFDQFGLDVEATGGSLALRTQGNEHVWGRIHEGASKRLAYLSLSCWDDEFEPLVAQLKTYGAQPASGPYVDTEGFWFLDPDGNLLQLKAGPKTTPSRMTPVPAPQRRPGRPSATGRSAARRVHPRRLSHLLMFTPDINRAITFYRDALGLRLSDRSRDIVAFMHARHGCDHHLIAFVAGSAKGWHHSSWDVADVDEVGRGGEQMREAGYKEGWGTGRHVLGSNHFHYVRDPWGSFAEYSAGIDFVPMGATWQAGDHLPEDSLYLWGPELPEYFIHNTEA